MLHIIAPVILLTGLISQVLLWNYDFNKEDRKKFKQLLGIPIPASKALPAERDDSDPSKSEDIFFDGWTHVPENCPGCYRGSIILWHRHVCDDVVQAGVQGKLSQVIYPLMNIWQNVVDKNTA